MYTGFKSIKVMLLVVIIGLLVHGMFLSKLGFYRDDSWQFMQGMQVADSNTMGFILSDTSGNLLTERPFAYIASTLVRTGFAMSPAMLHWILVGLLILNALVLANLSRRICNEEWFAFSVGVIFLIYPLSTIQTIMPSGIHYLCASLLTFLAIWFSLYGLICIEGPRLRWFVLGSSMYLASLLTHEQFALIYPVFIGISMLSNYRDRERGWLCLKKMYSIPPAIVWLSSFLVTLALYGLWRWMILPIYEAGSYVGMPSYKILLDPALLAEKLIVGTDTVFIPWDQALVQILRFRPPLWSILLPLIVSVAVWVIISKFLSDLRITNQILESNGIVKDVPWWQAVIIGTVLVIAALGPVGLSAANRIDRINGVVSKVNFGALAGIALGLPAACVLLMRFYKRSSKVANLVVLTCMTVAGFIHVMVRRSDIALLLGHYPPDSRFVVIGIIIGITVGAFITIIFSHGRTARNRVLGHVGGKVGRGLALIRAHFLAGIIASLALLGSFFHFSVKNEWATAWHQHKLMLTELQTIAPALQDETFVLIDAKTSNQLIKRVVPGGELSVHLLALYNNWSIMGLIIMR